MTASQLLRTTRLLPRRFYARPTITVAQDLLGAALVHRQSGMILAGRIVETEAYLGGSDEAAHSSRGLTPRTRVIFGPPGHAYVYLCYGMYECLNLIAEPRGKPGCVLIRALEPLCGVSRMQALRPAARQLADIASGPGKLTLAMGVTRRYNGVDVTRGALTVRQWKSPQRLSIGNSPRIGISKSAELPLRFFLKENEHVSRRNG